MWISEVRRFLDIAATGAYLVNSKILSEQVAEKLARDEVAAISHHRTPLPCERNIFLCSPAFNPRHQCPHKATTVRFGVRGLSA